MDPPCPRIHPPASCLSSSCLPFRQSALVIHMHQSVLLLSPQTAWRCARRILPVLVMYPCYPSPPLCVGNPRAPGGPSPVPPNRLAMRARPGSAAAGPGYSVPCAAIGLAAGQARRSESRLAIRGDRIRGWRFVLRSDSRPGRRGRGRYRVRYSVPCPEIGVPSNVPPLARRSEPRPESRAAQIEIVFRFFIGVYVNGPISSTGSIGIARGADRNRLPLLHRRLRQRGLLRRPQQDRLVRDEREAIEIAGISSIEAVEVIPGHISGVYCDDLNRISWSAAPPRPAPVFSTIKTASVRRSVRVGGRARSVSDDRPGSSPSESSLTAGCRRQFYSTPMRCLTIRDLAR